jgi:type II secretory ATPase GspE/PulE/Tfp pilus assembly ATPase PilB-like protein
MLHMEGDVRRLLGASTEEIFVAARAQGMRTLREEGHRLCLEGVCSLAEIDRVIGDRVD